RVCCTSTPTYRVSSSTSPSSYRSSASTGVAPTARARWAPTPSKAPPSEHQARLPGRRRHRRDRFHVHIAPSDWRLYGGNRNTGGRRQPDPIGAPGVSVVVIGLNHRTVSLDLLERMTVDASRLPKVLADLRGRDHLSEAVVLSTCNRTEVYAVAERFHGAYGDVRDTLAELSFLPPEAFSDHLYSHYDADAVRHLFSVAAGLDSAVLGESEILGQV